jgi:glyoxalase family protein
MSKEILGIHHVTAIAADPQRNVDFYTGILGLRLVKLTVNFDDPGTYHLYYGDQVGHPGTILTFFAWPGARRGLRGNGQVSAVSFSIPEEAVSYWQGRLKQHGISVGGPSRRFDEEALVFVDPDGMQLALVAHAGAGTATPWEGGPVPGEYAIQGLRGVTLWEASCEPTVALLSDTLGFRLVQEVDSRFRFQVPADGPGPLVDIVCRPYGQQGRMGAGMVHHIAWRTPSDEEQMAWREGIARVDLNVTPVIDRQYFRSIYLREAGGVLFEIATDPPGFTVDEPLERLGQHLMLPPWLEPERAGIERVLPELRLDVFIEPQPFR